MSNIWILLDNAFEKEQKKNKINFKCFLSPSILAFLASWGKKRTKLELYKDR